MLVTVKHRRRLLGDYSNFLDLYKRVNNLETKMIGAVLIGLKRE